MSDPFQPEPNPAPMPEVELLPGLAAVPEVRSLLEAVDLPIGRWDADGRLTFFNPPYVSWARRNPDQLRGRTLKELYGDEAWAAAQPAFERGFAGKQADYLRLLRHLDPPRWARIQVFPERGMGGRIEAIYTIAHDVHDDVTAAMALKRSNWLLEQALDNLPWGVIESNAELIVTRWSRSAEAILGYSEAERLGTHRLAMGVPEEERARTLAVYERLLRGEIDNWVEQAQYIRKDRRRIWVEWTLSALRDEEGRVVSLLTFVRDITHQIDTHARLLHRAERDALTGVLTRRAIMERLDTALARRTRDDMLALCFIDLDGFKQINDRLGHVRGDRLLVQVAHAMQDVLRRDDAIGRIGGDEFVALSAVADLSAAQSLAAKLVEVCAAAGYDLLSGMRVTASIGVAAAPTHARSSFELLQRADDAMYVAKQQGKNRWNLCHRHIDGADFAPHHP
ncbi:sensor domain-containing diguanylate cyclase [Thiomonas arsenitoxydans]|uniref:sensor domain-containing diguanylate cyclase n=1 Tax=Thiomonas arsenitoxydans (strain DSM 22701 / CIP 110005 / 3As) TaxID=426114 RepID=UPI001ACDBC69|nr:sensor domain-containing diguanylate cyclase [Thiomonas arsenitoxydans]MBN8775809.1 diguanylate cyclase [Thiomonas arsenitoxydans]